MSRTIFAVGQFLFTFAARWLFFWPGDQLLRAAEFCQERARDNRPRDGPASR